MEKKMNGENYQDLLTKIEEVKSIVKDAQSPFLDVPKAAVYLQISTSKLRKLIAEGKIPFDRVDGKLVFHKRKLELFVLTCGKTQFSKTDKKLLEVLQ